MLEGKAANVYLVAHDRHHFSEEEAEDGRDPPTVTPASWPCPDLNPAFPHSIPRSLQLSSQPGPALSHTTGNPASYLVSKTKWENGMFPWPRQQTRLPRDSAVAGAGPGHVVLTLPLLERARMGEHPPQQRWGSLWHRAPQPLLLLPAFYLDSLPTGGHRTRQRL